MMRILFLPVLVMLFFSGCKDNGQEILPDLNSKDTSEKHQDTLNSADFFMHDQQADTFQLSEILIEDFNGDGISDTAIFETHGKKSGVVIYDGLTTDSDTLGCGIIYSDDSDDLSWASCWGIFRGEATYDNVLLDDGSLETLEVTLNHPAIFIYKIETGGGMIIFKNGSYTWLDQSC